MEYKSKEEKRRYERWISYSYPFPLCRKRSSLSHRAVQFFSFAALKGYEELIGETRSASEDLKKRKYRKESIEKKV